jgi:hypothetical protein
MQCVAGADGSAGEEEGSAEQEEQVGGTADRVHCRVVHLVLLVSNAASPLGQPCIVKGHQGICAHAHKNVGIEVPSHPACACGV